MDDADRIGLGRRRAVRIGEREAAKSDRLHGKLAEVTTLHPILPYARGGRYALAARLRPGLRGIDRFCPRPIFFASAERVLA